MKNACVSSILTEMVKRVPRHATNTEIPLEIKLSELNSGLRKEDVF